MPASHEAVMARIESLYRMLFEHNGYGEMTIEIRYLRKKEKEVLIRCGKQYRFVVPCGCGDDACGSCGSSADAVSAKQQLPNERGYAGGKNQVAGAVPAPANRGD